MSTSAAVQKQLDNIIKYPSNNKCGDCKKKNNPRWSSYSLGLIICIQCAGIHRSLGTHITKVKSVDLDSWKEEDVEMLLKMRGNDRANLKYEGKLMVSNNKIIEYVPRLDELRSYIKTKYESKRWYLSDDEFKKYDGNNNIVAEEVKVIEKTPVKPVVKEEKKPDTNMFDLNKKFSKTSLYEQQPSTDRTELKKSILALYSKPKDATVTKEKSVSLDQNDLFKDLI